MKSYYFGIKTNNLRNIDISIPNKNIGILSGPSGSGKSSIAIDTIHKISEDELNQLTNLKDGRARYVISDYQNILPSICLQQENYNSNPRSTIATYFNVDSYFKELFSLHNPGVSQKTFQFNSIPGSCESCSGSGVSIIADSIKIADYSEKVKNIPFRNWKNSKSDFYKKILISFCIDNNINVEKKFKDLSEGQQRLLLKGVSNQEYFIKYKSVNRNHRKTTQYKGPIYELNEEIINGKLSVSKKKYLSDGICNHCNGTRFSSDTLKYKLYNKNIGELYLMEFDSLYKWILEQKRYWDNKQVEKNIFNRIIQFLKPTLSLNLEYLNLNRSIPSLSGGELQRLRLSKAVNSQFVNFLYILDEPTSGLHPSEWYAISTLISELKEKYNTVLIIENNLTIHKISNDIIYIGPSGGKNGGQIVKKSDYSKHHIDIKYKFYKANNFLKIDNASHNNIRNISIDIPLNSLVGICGVSGSGKSSFLYGILPKFLNEVVYLNQSPIKSNYYSIIATSIGVFSDIQSLFSKANKVTKDYFSYMSKGKGQCQTCFGIGFLKDDSPYVKTETLCPTCEGKRFSKTALKYKVNGLNIYELLSMSIEEIIEYIPNENTKIIDILNIVNSIGMGYISLIQNVSTLSGGEAQRVKFTRSISKHPGRKVYLLDEPFRGVDDNNIAKIICYFYKLIDKGYSIFIAEHKIFALDYCSYLIEFGPKGGIYGGEIVYFGEKKNIKVSKKSLTGQYFPGN